MSGDTSFAVFGHFLSWASSFMVLFSSCVPRSSGMFNCFSMLLLISSHFSFSYAVTCPNCAGTIRSCTFDGDGAPCPLVAVVTANAVALKTGAAGVVMLAVGIPTRITRIFTRRVLDRISFLKGRFNSREPFDTAAKSGLQLYEAFSEGLLRSSEATANLARILVKTTDKTDRENIQALMLAVANEPKSTLKDHGGDSQPVGVYTYTWLKCVEYVQGAARSSTRSDGEADSSISIGFGKNQVPKTSDNFYEVLNMFLLIVTTTALVNPLIMLSFLQKVVYEPMRNHLYSWMMAMELFLTYVHTIESSDDSDITFGNVVEKGGTDHHATEAVLRGKEHFGSIFRKLRLEASGRNGSKNEDGDVSTKVWNNTFSHTSKQYCQSWNRNQTHPEAHLLSDGTCKFNHGCCHWVSDKGPGGMCGNTSHKWGKCDNPAKCDAKATA